jgi:hypothetical protein
MDAIRRLALATALVSALGLSVVSATTSAPTTVSSVAYKMAVIDCKCVPSATRVAPYRLLLAKLVTRKCTERPLKLADELTTVRHMLAHDGYGNYSYLRLMRLLDRSIPNSIRYRQRCAGVLAALVVLIEH